VKTAKHWLLAANLLSLAGVILLGHPHSFYFVLFSFATTAGQYLLTDLDRRLPAAPAPKPRVGDDEFDSPVDALRVLAGRGREGRAEG
jgi:hypothetical protein